MSNLYCVTIKPRASIGYHYSVVADSPRQALAVLSWGLRTRLKLSKMVEYASDYDNTAEVIRILRRPWRIVPKSWGWRERHDKVSVANVAIPVMQVAYPETMLVRAKYGIVTGDNLRNEIDWGVERPK